MDNDQQEADRVASLGGDRRGHQRPAHASGTGGGRAIDRRAVRTCHPDGCERRYSRATIDRWVRAWRAGGLDALDPSAAC